MVFDPVINKEGYTYRVVAAAGEISPSLITEDNISLRGIVSGEDMEIANVYYDMKTLNAIIEVVSSDVYDAQYIVKFSGDGENKKVIGNIEAYIPAKYDTVSISKVEISDNIAYVTVENAAFDDRNITVYLKDGQGNILLFSQADLFAESTTLLTFDLSGIEILSDECEWSVE